MAGRPLLALIDRIVSSKCDNGAVVDFIWVKAHSNENSILSAGNRVSMLSI